MVLTAERLWSRASHPVPVYQRLPVKDATKIWRGQFLGDSGDAGFAKATIDADVTSIGIAEETVDNTVGVAADGSLFVLAILSCRLWVPVSAFKSGEAYDGANDINSIVYWVNASNEFSSSATNNINLGKIDAYEAAGPSQPAGFWVNFKARQVRDV